MANEFFVQPANPLQALMAGEQAFGGAQKRMREADLIAGRQAAGQRIAAGDYQGALSQLMSDPEAAKVLATVAHHRATEEQAKASRAQSEAQFAATHGLAQRQFGLEERKATPEHMRAAAEAKAKPREFNVSDITKLSEEGGKFANIKTFTETFEPRFAGYGAKFLGDIATTAGRYAPGLTTKDTADTATWWQGYDRFKNVVRNELFGSALTAPEKAAFEKADINPGMDPTQVKKNLETQREIAVNGLKRKANALIQSGYDPKAISAAYGLELSEIGVKDQGRAPKGTPTPATQPQNDHPAIVEARNAIGRGKSREAVEARLRQMKIPFQSSDLDLN